MKSNTTYLLRVALVTLLYVGFMLTPSQAQMRVGQPSGSPDGSAALDVSGGPYPSGSPFRGILPPKVSLTQTSAATPINNPAVGLLIYNTAKAGDVTPGYYYWEGSKWLRFSTTSPGSARVATAGGGQYIQAYTISQAQALTTPVDIIYIVDPGQEGMFRYVSGATNIVDGGLTLNATNGRYKRIFDGPVNVQWFGAKGDGVTNDTQAFQKAINSNRKIFVPRTSGGNLYIISDSLVKNNNGSIIIEGESLDVVLQMTTDRDLIRFTSNNDNGGYIQITNISLYAGVNMSSGAAINIRAKNYQKVAFLSNIRISRADPTQEFKYGIRIENPFEAVLKDIIISGNNTAKLIGVSLTSTQSAISPTLSNIKVYSANTGLLIRSNSNPGIEGLKLFGCDFVGVNVGIDAQSTVNPATYVPPGLQFVDCHINASTGGITIANYVQADVTNAIIYCNGGSSFNYGVSLYNVGESSVTFSKIFRVGSGAVYGVLANSGTNINLKIAFNHFTLKPDGTEQGIWFGDGTTYSHALYNTIVGLSGTGGSDVYNQNGTNTVVGNSRR